MASNLNKKYFGNRNIGTTGTSDDNIGGQGVASITLGGVNNSSGYALNDPINIGAPNLPGGVQATAKVATLGASNSIATIEVTEKGSGYTSVPTVTESVGGLQGTLTFTAVLTTDTGAPGSSTNQENALTPFAYVTGGTRKVADIIRQVGGRRYKVKTADGIMTCSLKTSAASNAAGEMDLTATDSSGKTYYVKKLTGHKATLVRYGTAGHEFATDTAVQWTFGAASSGVSVTIANA